MPSKRCACQTTAKTTHPVSIIETPVTAVSCSVWNRDHTINIGTLALEMTRCSLTCAQPFKHLADPATQQSCGYATQCHNTQHTEQLQTHRHKAGGKGRKQCRQRQLTIRRSSSGGLGMMTGAFGASAPVKAVAKMSIGVTFS